MQQSESIAKIVTALVGAQAKIKNPSLDAKNPHYNSRYTSLEGYLNAVRIPLSENGIALMQGVSSQIENGQQIKVTTMLAHTSGEWIRDTVGMNLPTNAKAQDIGSTISYLRRYALSSMLAMTGEDDDAEADRETRSRPAPKPPAAARTDAPPARSAEQTRDVFDPQPVAKEGGKATAMPKPLPKRKWPDTGKDVVKVEKAVERGDGFALLCNHVTHSNLWVSASKEIGASVKADTLIELTWEWNTVGEFMQAKKIEEPVRFKDLIAKGEIPF